MIEVEYYRRVAERTVGRVIARVHAPDDWYLKGGTTAAALRRALRGADRHRHPADRQAAAARHRRRHVGLRFGMTGRLLVDGAGPIEKLEYSSARQEPAWTRFALRFDGGGDLAVVDPRRLGGVVLDPTLDHLGIDALEVRERDLRAMLGASRAPLKAWLLDQSHVAGIGNLLADEILWRAGLDPSRPAASLDPRRGDGAAPHARPDDPPAHQARREPHRRPPGRPGAGRHVPPRRRPAAAPHDRWAHHLLLPRPPALTWEPTATARYPAASPGGRSSRRCEDHDEDAWPPSPRPPAWPPAVLARAERRRRRRRRARIDCTIDPTPRECTTDVVTTTILETTTTTIVETTTTVRGDDHHASGGRPPPRRWCRPRRRRSLDVSTSNNVLVPGDGTEGAESTTTTTVVPTTISNDDTSDGALARARRRRSRAARGGRSASSPGATGWPPDPR